MSAMRDILKGITPGSGGVKESCRRGGPRLTCSRVHSGRARVHDLSVRGCRVECKGTPPVQGRVYALPLVSDAGEMTIAARVAWVRKVGRKWIAGFEFNPANEAEREMLFRLAYDPTVFKHRED